MKITFEPSDEFQQVNGTWCRAWSGRTDSGLEVVAYVAAIAHHPDATLAQREEFERELLAAVPRIGQSGVGVVLLVDPPSGKAN